MNTKMMQFYKAIIRYLPLIAVLFLCACSAIDIEDISQDTDTRNEVLNSISSGSSSEIQEDMGTWSLISEEEATNLDPSSMRVYKEILQDEATFFSMDAQKDIKLSQLNQAVSSDSSVVANVSQFAILNPDGNESFDLVLRLTVNGNEYFGFEILHYQDNAVYGYTRWYRSLMDLKTDGSFLFSGGTADTGYGILQFDGTNLTEIVKTESRSNYDDNNVNVKFSPTLPELRGSEKIP